MLRGVILTRLEEYKDTVRVLFGHRVVDIEQNSEKVVAVVETMEGQRRLNAKYLVGADGARSTVRKQIGCTFDGFTYDKMIVAKNVYYPFIENGFHRGQFIVHPEHFALVRYFLSIRLSLSLYPFDPFVLSLCLSPPGHWASFSSSLTGDRKMRQRLHVPSLLRRRLLLDSRTSPLKPRKQIQCHIPRSQTRHR